MKYWSIFASALLVWPVSVYAASPQTVKVTTSYACAVEPDCILQTECLTNDASECTDLKICHGDKMSFELSLTDGKTDQNETILVIKKKSGDPGSPFFGKTNEDIPDVISFLAYPKEAEISLWLGIWRKDYKLVIHETRTDGPPSRVSYSGNCRAVN